MKENMCNVCNKQFSTTELRNIHLKNIQAFLLLYCKGCGFVGSARDSNHHHDYFLFCAVCKTFLSEHFWNHKCLHKKHVQELASKSRTSCGLCHKDFFSKLDATNHVPACEGKRKSDTDKESFVCQCCKKEFPDEDYLGFHLNFFQQNKNVFEHQCVTCNLNYEQADQYKDHVLQEHLSSIIMPDFSDSRRSRRKKRRSKVQTSQKLTSKVCCRFCNIKFSNKNIATAHERKHHGDELVECPLCFKQLKLEKMKGHNTTHRTQKCYQNSPTKICNICGVTVKNLQRHLTTHRNERKYKCSICCKDFKLAWDMKKHLRAHIGDAKYKCEVCGKGFKVSYNLKVHMRIHDSVKPFGCLVCEKTFTTKQSRDIHLKIHDRMSFVK